MALGETDMGSGQPGEARIERQGAIVDRLGERGAQPIEPPLR